MIWLDQLAFLQALGGDPRGAAATIAVSSGVDVVGLTALTLLGYLPPQTLALAPLLPQVERRATEPVLGLARESRDISRALARSLGFP